MQNIDKGHIINLLHKSEVIGMLLTEYDVENVVKVRTGEEGYDALQDVE